MKIALKMNRTGCAFLVLCLLTITSISDGKEPFSLLTFLQPPPSAPAVDGEEEALKLRVETNPDTSSSNTPSASSDVVPEVNTSGATFNFVSPAEIFTQRLGENSYFSGSSISSLTHQVVTDWTASAGPTFLSRRKGSKTGLVHNGAILASPVVFTPRDLKFDFQTGYNVDVTRHFDNFDIHLNHFAVDGWSSSGGISGALAGSHLRPGGLIFTGGRSQWDYTSTMASAEINIKSQTWSSITPFIGLRWVELDERLIMSSQFQPPGILNPKYILDTQNDLYGLQAGVDVALFNSERFELSGTGKIAIAGNAARNKIFTLPTASNFGNNLPEMGTGGATVAFIYDLAIKGKYQLSEHVTVSGGYSVIFLTHLALAPTQLERNQILNPVTFPNPGIIVPAGSRYLDTSDYLIVHGGQLNLEVTW